jgi:dUTP pyrophosphatase
MITVEFTKLDERAHDPMQAYPGDAGWDLHVLEDTYVPVGKPTDVRTGIAVAIPGGYYGRIAHRSSAPRRKGVMVLEGTIDAGFRGELFALAYVWRPTAMTFTPSMLRDEFEYRESGGVQLHAGESICQMIVQPVPQVTMVEVGSLAPAARGLAGFGSSGR